VSYADEAAGSNTTAESAEKARRHRIDLTAIFLDTISADTLNASIGYTYNLSPNSNISISIPYFDPDIDAAGDSGIGDAVASFSYIPSVTIGANPWLPRTVGTGVAVLMPTGDAAAGRSVGTWVVSAYAGLVIPLTDRVFIAPQFGYTHSLDKTVAGTDLRLASADLGIAYVAHNGFWSSYFPQVMRDLESDEWLINHRLAVGKMLSKDFGLSIDYVLVERFNFGSSLPGQPGFDEQIELNAHFAF